MIELIVGDGFDLAALPPTKAELIEEAAQLSRRHGLGLRKAAEAIYARYYADKPIVDETQRVTRVDSLRKLIRKRRNAIISKAPASTASI